MFNAHKNSQTPFYFFFGEHFGRRGGRGAAGGGRKALGTIFSKPLILPSDLELSIDIRFVTFARNPTIPPFSTLFLLSVFLSLTISTFDIALETVEVAPIIPHAPICVMSILPSTYTFLIVPP